MEDAEEEGEAVADGETFGRAALPGPLVGADLTDAQPQALGVGQQFDLDGEVLGGESEAVVDPAIKNLEAVERVVELHTEEGGEDGGEEEVAVAAGKGVLAVITFKAKAKGKTYINFTNCSVKNPRAENMASEFMMGEIVID